MNHNTNGAVKCQFSCAAYHLSMGETTVSYDPCPVRNPWRILLPGISTQVPMKTDILLICFRTFAHRYLEGLGIYNYI